MTKFILIFGKFLSYAVKKSEYRAVNIFTWKPTCAACDLVHFRKKIGVEGVEKIFNHTIELHGKDGQDKHISIDITVQEKNIIYPTDTKLQKKI